MRSSDCIAKLEHQYAFMSVVMSLMVKEELIKKDAFIGIKNALQEEWGDKDSDTKKFILIEDFSSIDAIRFLNRFYSPTSLLGNTGISTHNDRKHKRKSFDAFKKTLSDQAVIMGFAQEQFFNLLNRQMNGIADSYIYRDSKMYLVWQLYLEILSYQPRQGDVKISDPETEFRNFCKKNMPSDQKFDDNLTSRALYKKFSLIFHPDKAGSEDKFKELANLWKPVNDELLKEAQGKIAVAEVEILRGEKSILEKREAELKKNVDTSNGIISINKTNISNTITSKLDCNVLYSLLIAIPKVISVLSATAIVMNYPSILNKNLNINGIIHFVGYKSALFLPLILCTVASTAFSIETVNRGDDNLIYRLNLVLCTIGYFNSIGVDGLVLASLFYVVQDNMQNTNIMLMAVGTSALLAPSLYEKYNSLYNTPYRGAMKYISITSIMNDGDIKYYNESISKAQSQLYTDQYELKGVNTTIKNLESKIAQVTNRNTDAPPAITLSLGS